MSRPQFANTWLICTVFATLMLSLLAAAYWYNQLTMYYTAHLWPDRRELYPASLVYTLICTLFIAMLTSVSFINILTAAMDLYRFRVWQLPLILAPLVLLVIAFSSATGATSGDGSPNMRFEDVAVIHEQLDAFLATLGGVALFSVVLSRAAHLGTLSARTSSSLDYWSHRAMCRRVMSHMRLQALLEGMTYVVGVAYYYWAWRLLSFGDVPLMSVNAPVDAAIRASLMFTIFGFLPNAAVGLALVCIRDADGQSIIDMPRAARILGAAVVAAMPLLAAAGAAILG